MVSEPQKWKGYSDLNAFLDALKDDNDLIEIREKVSPRYEIGAILKELGEREGPAALFNNVAGFPGKVIIGNILGHRRRLAKALGVNKDDLTNAYLRRKNQGVPPVQVAEAPIMQVPIGVDQLNLLQILPALIHHERDTSPYLTCAVTFARDPENGRQSMGLHRIRIHSEKRLAICLETPPLVNFLHKAREMNTPLEVAVVIGPDPAVLIASVTWCPAGQDKIEIAGALKKKPVQMVQCKTVNLQVPSHSQYLIEGIIQPGDTAREDIFGESSGTYVEGVESPAITVTHLSHRADPLYQALQTWSSEDDAFFDLCFGSDILEKVQKDFPFVRDLHLIAGTVGGHINVSVNECSTPMLRSAMAAILIRNPFVKKVVVVNEDIDIRNYREMEWAMATRFQADRDLFLLPGVHGSIIDPSASTSGASCKIGLDATFPKERFTSFQKVEVPKESHMRAVEILDRLSDGL